MGDRTPNPIDNENKQRRAVARRTILTGGLALFGLGLLEACTQAAPAATPAATATKAPAAATPAATAAATTAAPAATTAAATKAPVATTAAATTTAPSGTAAAGPALPANLGGTVSVLATWGGEEQASFLAMVQPFEQRTGAKMQYEGTRDLNAVLTTRVQGGNPPDLAGLPGPGQMAQFAQQNKLIDLAGVLDMNAMRAQYAQSWLDLGTSGGKLVGIFIKSSLKGPIWYNPKTFQAAGYQIPKTWDEMNTLTKRIADSGTTPWSIALEAAAASGWPGTDWIEDILLRQAGPDAYARWYQGQLKWTSNEVKTAFQTWGTIVSDAKMVFGGRQYMLATNFQDGANPLFQTPPKAFLHHQASFITDFIVKANPTLKPVTDFNYFMFPDINAQYAGAAIGGGDLFGMFRNTPQSKALMQWLVSAEAQAIWVKRGGALSPNKLVTAQTYPDDLSRRLAQSLLDVKTLRFDGSDLMPEQMNNAFWRAILDYVSNPAQLDAILTRLDGVQATAYTR